MKLVCKGCQEIPSFGRCDHDDDDDNDDNDDDDDDDIPVAQLIFL